MFFRSRLKIDELPALITANKQKRNGRPLPDLLCGSASFFYIIEENRRPQCQDGAAKVPMF
jgi:hypothetical protein